MPVLPAPKTVGGQKLRRSGREEEAGEFPTGTRVRRDNDLHPSRPGVKLLVAAAKKRVPVKFPGFVRPKELTLEDVAAVGGLAGAPGGAAVEAGPMAGDITMVDVGVVDVGVVVGAEGAVVEAGPVAGDITMGGDIAMAEEVPVCVLVEFGGAVVEAGPVVGDITVVEEEEEEDAAVVVGKTRGVLARPLFRVSKKGRSGGGSASRAGRCRAALRGVCLRWMGMEVEL